MKVLILGLGYTGKRLAQALMQQNVPVLGTNRTGQGVPLLPVPVFQFVGGSDLASQMHLWDKAHDVTHVLSTIAPQKDGNDPAWSLLRHHPDPNSIQWAGYLSTTGVYGDTHGAWVDEQSEVNPGNARSQARVNIERQWLDFDLPVHVFRLPGIYGPDRSVFERLRTGRAQHIIKPGHVFSRVHVDDIVQTVARSMQHPTAGEIYNVVDDEPSEPRMLVQEGAKLLNMAPPPPILFEDAEFSPMGRSFWAECRRVSNQKIKQKLGITLRYPSYREGLRAILNA